MVASDVIIEAASIVNTSDSTIVASNSIAIVPIGSIAGTSIGSSTNPLIISSGSTDLSNFEFLFFGSLSVYLSRSVLIPDTALTFVAGTETVEITENSTTRTMRSTDLNTFLRPYNVVQIANDCTASVTIQCAQSPYGDLYVSATEKNVVLTLEVLRRAQSHINWTIGGNIDSSVTTPSVLSYGQGIGFTVDTTRCGTAGTCSHADGFGINLRNLDIRLEDDLNANNPGGEITLTTPNASGSAGFGINAYRLQAPVIDIDSGGAIGNSNQRIKVDTYEAVSATNLMFNTTCTTSCDVASSSAYFEHATDALGLLNADATFVSVNGIFGIAQTTGNIIIDTARTFTSYGIAIFAVQGSITLGADIDAPKIALRANRIITQGSTSAPLEDRTLAITAAGVAENSLALHAVSSSIANTDNRLRITEHTVGTLNPANFTVVLEGSNSSIFYHANSDASFTLLTQGQYTTGANVINITKNEFRLTNDDLAAINLNLSNHSLYLESLGGAIFSDCTSACTLESNSIALISNTTIGNNSGNLSIITKGVDSTLILQAATTIGSATNSLEIYPRNNQTSIVNTQLVVNAGGNVYLSSTNSSGKLLSGSYTLGASTNKLYITQNQGDLYLPATVGTSTIRLELEVSNGSIFAGGGNSISASHDLLVRVGSSGSIGTALAPVTIDLNASGLSTPTLNINPGTASGTGLYLVKDTDNLTLEQFLNRIMNLMTVPTLSIDFGDAAVSLAADILLPSTSLSFITTGAITINTNPITAQMLSLTGASITTMQDITVAGSASFTATNGTVTIGSLSCSTSNPCTNIAPLSLSAAANASNAVSITTNVPTVLTAITSDNFTLTTSNNSLVRVDGSSTVSNGSWNITWMGDSGPFESVAGSTIQLDTLTLTNSSQISLAGNLTIDALLSVVGATTGTTISGSLSAGTLNIGQMLMPSLSFTIEDGGSLSVTGDSFVAVSNDAVVNGTYRSVNGIIAINATNRVLGTGSFFARGIHIRAGSIGMLDQQIRYSLHGTAPTPCGTTVFGYTLTCEGEATTNPSRVYLESTDAAGVIAIASLGASPLTQLRLNTVNGMTSSDLRLAFSTLGSKTVSLGVVSGNLVVDAALSGTSGAYEIELASVMSDNATLDTIQLESIAGSITTNNLTSPITAPTIILKARNLIGSVSNPLVVSSGTNEDAFDLFAVEIQQASDEPQTAFFARAQDPNGWFNQISALTEHVRVALFQLNNNTLNPNSVNVFFHQPTVIHFYNAQGQCGGGLLCLIFNDADVSIAAQRYATLSSDAQSFEVGVLVDAATLTSLSIQSSNSISIATTIPFALNPSITLVAGTSITQASHITLNAGATGTVALTSGTDITATGTITASNISLIAGGSIGDCSNQVLCFTGLTNVNNAITPLTVSTVTAVRAGPGNGTFIALKIEDNAMVFDMLPNIGFNYDGAPSNSNSHLLYIEHNGANGISLSNISNTNTIYR